MHSLKQAFNMLYTVFSWALPIGMGAYFAVNACVPTFSFEKEKTYQQLRVRVVDGLSQPLSGTRIDCPELGISGVTDTFGELVAKATVIPVALCQLRGKATSKGKTKRSGAGQSKDLAQQRLIHLEKLKTNHFTIASLDP